MYFVGVWTFNNRTEAQSLADKINRQAMRGLRDFVEVVEVGEPVKVVTMTKPRFNSDTPIRRTFYVYENGTAVEVFHDGVSEVIPSWNNLRIVMVTIGVFKEEEQHG